MKRLWQRLHGLLGEEPSGETGTHTADGFAAFFTSKVDQVRASTASTPPYNVPFRTTPTLDEWTHVTVEEVDKLMAAALNKTCTVPVRPSPHVAGERYARAIGTIRCSDVQ